MLDLRRLRSRFGRPVDLSAQVNGYRAVFRSPAGIEVLADLAEFCGAYQPAPNENMARAAGRRDVWLRIQQHLNLSEGELYRLLRGESILTPEDFNG